MKTVVSPSGLPQLLSTAELAEYLQVSESTVRCLARNGRIPAVRVGLKLWRFDLSEVEERLRQLGGVSDA